MKKNLLLTLFAIIALACCFGLAWKKSPKPKPQKKLTIEVLIELQEMVGARPDGVIGPETKRLVNAQCKIEKPEYFNNLAAPYHTPSGAPRKDR